MSEQEVEEEDTSGAEDVKDVEEVDAEDEQGKEVDEEDGQGKEVDEEDEQGEELDEKQKQRVIDEAKAGNVSVNQIVDFLGKHKLTHEQQSHLYFGLHTRNTNYGEPIPVEYVKAAELAGELAELDTAREAATQRARARTTLAPAAAAGNEPSWEVVAAHFSASENMPWEDPEGAAELMSEYMALMAGGKRRTRKSRRPRKSRRTRRTRRTRRNRKSRRNKITRRH